jgi:hypothetical protein
MEKRKTLVVLAGQEECLSSSFSKSNSHNPSSHQTIAVATTTKATETATTNNNNSRNKRNMIHRLLKRFKTNPPREETPAAKPRDKQRRSKRSTQKDMDRDNDEPQHPQKQEEKQIDSNDDNASIASSDSSYSNYDYLGKAVDAAAAVAAEMEDGKNPTMAKKKQKNNASSENDDDNDDGDGSVSSGSSSSSYSDYDDYQFLTVVAAAAAARKSPAKDHPSASENSSGDVVPMVVVTTPCSPQAKKVNDKDQTTTENSNQTEGGKVEGPIKLEDLARTHFPDFFSDTAEGLPGAILSDESSESSDDETTIQRKTEQYHTKEDEDVAVFMNIAKRMDLKSLLHLLQGHVQSQNAQYAAEYMKQYNAALATHHDSMTSLPESNNSLTSILSNESLEDGDERAAEGEKLEEEKKDETKVGTPSSDEKKKKSSHREKKKPCLVKKKQFRWAEITAEKVRVVVHEIESIKSESNLWWQPEEMHAIRVDLVDTVKFFRKHRPNYINSVEVVARHGLDMSGNNGKGSPQQQVVEQHMKSLMSAEHSYARGLETHIVKMLSDHRKATVTAILDEQQDCKDSDDDYATTMHCLREQSLAYTTLSSKFAYAMARCDQIDALKASMSSWSR